nr:acyltransferase [Hydrogenophaga aromaticivorans]
MGFNPVLHGLRGLAALYVMLYHWNGTFKGLRVQLEQVTIFGEPWHWGFWLQFGWTGVLWFFVLSGYLLTAQMLARPVDMSGASDFWLRRAMRIYPAVWAQLAILLPLVALTGNLKSFSWYQLLGNLGLWLSPFPGAVAPFNAVYWTLPIELLFYLALPLLVWLFRRVNVWVFLALALAFTLSWRLGLYWQGKAGGVVGPQVAWVRDSMPGFFFVFATGMALNRIQLPWSDRARQAAVLLLVLAYGLLIQAMWARRATPFMESTVLMLSDFVLATLSAAVVALLLKPLPGFLWLCSRPLVFLGEVSYGIYLWHFPIQRLMPKWFPGAFDGVMGSLWALLVSSVLTLALAWASYRWVERPALDWLGRRARRKAIGRIETRTSEGQT